MCLRFLQKNFAINKTLQKNGDEEEADEEA